jgi:regulator of sigma E protease
MIISFLYVILAAFGLGFLIFIHELGHYWMARREGMTIEAFSIGFGKPIYSWERNGVKWQFCWLPFGGFVRIAGMEKKGALEPYQIPDGFYGKKPWARIKVAVMGPIINIGFAFFAFCLLWVLGGRSKPFSEYTHLIGWVDPCSEIYHVGVRPGDEITQLNNKPFRNFQDFIYAAIFEGSSTQISGQEVDYFKGEKAPFQYRFPIAKDVSIGEYIRTIFSTVQPAAYLIYKQNSSLPFETSPMKESGIQDGDRILWADGKLLFSVQELIETINEPKALLTIQRDEQFFLARVPRLKISDLRLTPAQRAELEDWQHEAKIKGKSSDLFFIPYHLSCDCQIENVFSYLNVETIEQQPTGEARSPLEIPLQPGDRVIAVDGLPISSAYELIHLLQTRHIQIIVNKESPNVAPISWKKADSAFVTGIHWNDLEKMIQSIGTREPIKQLMSLRLLNPVSPKPMSQLSIPEEKREQMEAVLAGRRKEIEHIKDPKQKAQAERLFEAGQNQVKLGILPVNRNVIYNPSPFVLFHNVFQETWKTIVALFTGNVSPKYMTGPVGIVHVMQQSWGYGFTEALFWLGMISLNLGVLNLLPVPVLDGGHICFSLWEWVTKKPIKAKTMERLIIPFIILLVALFIYMTYNDLMRLFSGFFK